MLSHSNVTHNTERHLVMFIKNNITLRSLELRIACVENLGFNLNN